MRDENHVSSVHGSESRVTWKLQVIIKTLVHLVMVSNNKSTHVRCYSSSFISLLNIVIFSRSLQLLTRKQSEPADLRQGHVFRQLAAPYSVWQRFPLRPIESNVNKNFKVIQNPGFLPDHPQNWITGRFCHSRHSQKISERSVHNFLSYLADTQTDRQTKKAGKNITSLAEVIIRKLKYNSANSSTVCWIKSWYLPAVVHVRDLGCVCRKCITHALIQRILAVLRDAAISSAVT